MIQKKYLKAAEWYMKGIDADPYFRGDEENRCYCYLRRIKENVPDPQVRNKISGYVKRFNPADNPHIFYNLKELRTQEIYAWIIDDLNDMLDIIKEKHIKIILHNYPPREGATAAHVKSVNGILRDTAYQRKIVFVDHERLFQEMWDSGYDPKRYHRMHGQFMDFHLNEQGYERMAYYIFETIKENDFMGLEKEN